MIYHYILSISFSFYIAFTSFHESPSPVVMRVLANRDHVNIQRGKFLPELGTKRGLISLLSSTILIKPKFQVQISFLYTLLFKY